MDSFHVFTCTRLCRSGVTILDAAQSALFNSPESSKVRPRRALNRMTVLSGAVWWGVVRAGGREGMWRVWRQGTEQGAYVTLYAPFRSAYSRLGRGAQAMARSDDLFAAAVGGAGARPRQGVPPSGGGATDPAGSASL